MDIKKWIRSVTKEDRSGTIAVKIGVNAGTFKRQYDAGKIPPINLVKIARAYGIPPLSALVACGLITEEEANIDDADIKAIKEALENTKQLAQNAIGLEAATDEQLLQELLRRVKTRGKLNPTLSKPIDSEQNKAVRTYHQKPGLTIIGGDITGRSAASDHGYNSVEEVEAGEEQP